MLASGVRILISGGGTTLAPGAAACLLGAYDALIAAQAVRRGITLVTANTKEFKRVDGLLWENWARRKSPKS